MGKRMQKDVQSIVFGVADTLKSSQGFNENGFIELIVLKVPSFTNGVTVTKLEILDDDGDVIWTLSTGWAQNATFQITSVDTLGVPVNTPRSNNYYQVRVTLSGAPGGTGGTVTVKSYIKANSV